MTVDPYEIMNHFDEKTLIDIRERLNGKALRSKGQDIKDLLVQDIKKDGLDRVLRVVKIKSLKEIAGLEILKKKNKKNDDESLSIDGEDERVENSEELDKKRFTKAELRKLVLEKAIDKGYEQFFQKFSLEVLFDICDDVVSDLLIFFIDR